MNRDELRNEIRDVIAGHPIGYGYYATTVGIDDAQGIIDTLLDGPVGELLDENRLQSLIRRRQERAIEGLVGLQSERDQLHATLKAVREVVLDHDYPAGAIYDLRRILNGAEGGADCCHTKHGGPVNPDACHRCYVETRHVRDGGGEG